MRPIVLDLNGFASFREPTTIDFADADFFALVGPTGSGKSTVIDAMTFALYGSVPRWGRKGMVSLALAPTVARGTVKLVFDAGEHRYVVARELRRTGAQVSQRAASLERLADPRGLAQPGDPTEVLAKDLAGVSTAVERLLGLSYEDFCQCVVLPQGQFANFLHAKASERQEIMLRLLGAEHYRQMMMRANQRASTAALRADAVTETLGGLADARPEAEEAARAAERTLAGLSERVAAAGPRLTAAAGALAAAEAELARYQTEQAALAAVRVPGDVTDLDTGLAGSRARLDQARAAEQRAGEADQAARAALADGPDRAPLELARERRAQRAAHEARRPELAEQAAAAAAAAARAEAAVQEAARALDELRTRRDEAARGAEEAAQRVTELAAEHAALAAVTVPDGITRLDDRRRAAQDALRAASAGLDAAEQADAAARAALDGSAGVAPLQQVLADLGELADLDAKLAPARGALDLAREQRVAADAAQQAAEAASQQRQRDLDDARRAHVAAGLRPHLVSGQPCPVCEQPVGTLPPPLADPAIGQAQARLDEAARAAAAARDQAKTAATVQAAAAADLDALTGQRTRRTGSLTAALAGPLASVALPVTAGLVSQEAAAPVSPVSPVDPASPVPPPAAGPARAGAQASRAAEAIAEITAKLAERRGLDQAAQAAAAAAVTARGRQRSAQQALTEADDEMTAARNTLRRARDPLVALGAPELDEAALADGWAALARWAAGQAQDRSARLAEARQAALAAAGQRDRARAAFAAADTGLAGLRAADTSTAKADQQARTRLTELTERIAELDRLLSEAPDEGELTKLLAVRDELEQAAAACERRLLAAREARTRAERAHADLERAETAARARLSAARDPVVGLGAPALDGGLLAGWTALAAWAAREAAARDQHIAAARARAAAARADGQHLAAGLSAELAAAGLDLAPDAVAAGAAPAVAGALERARGAISRLAERRAQAADLIGRRDAAQQDHQVARLLGSLLRSDNFPQWLVTAAVEDLVADASQKLAGLSGGQFDLTYTDGDFYVIDHADADSSRSVRTLSGGETFQASLALALALSAQISALTTAGAARLDSIFLDEGFGTLDPETLEVVATTLETLAQGQQMVGVITHVAALAERVPVRFLVSRNARSSSVTREGLTAADGTP